jgi:glycine cleavage system aminomethyltransferase T
MLLGSSSEQAWRPLHAVLEQAGAVFAGRGAERLAIHYGSPAGELAVCVREVGLVDCSELDKLHVEAGAGELDRLTDELFGSHLSPGGALRSGAAWWCRQSAEAMTAVCAATAGRQIRRRLRECALRHAGLGIHDRSRELAAIGLIGRHAPDVLRSLGVYGPAGDPRRTAPFTRAPVAGVQTWWLLESDHHALALVEEQHAGEVWQALEHAGRKFGISCVGADAATRYRLLERATRRTAIAA